MSDRIPAAAIGGPTFEDPIAEAEHNSRVFESNLEAQKRADERAAKTLTPEEKADLAANPPPWRNPNSIDAERPQSPVDDGGLPEIARSHRTLGDVLSPEAYRDYCNQLVRGEFRVGAGIDLGFLKAQVPNLLAANEALERENAILAENCRETAERYERLRLAYNENLKDLQTVEADKEKFASIARGAELHAAELAKTERFAQERVRSLELVAEEARLGYEDKLKTTATLQIENYQLRDKIEAVALANNQLVSNVFELRRANADLAEDAQIARSNLKTSWIISAIAVALAILANFVVSALR